MICATARERIGEGLPYVLIGLIQRTDTSAMLTYSEQYANIRIVGASGPQTPAAQVADLSGTADRHSSRICLMQPQSAALDYTGSLPPRRHHPMGPRSLCGQEVLPLDAHAELSRLDRDELLQLAGVLLEAMPSSYRWSVVSSIRHAQPRPRPVEPVPLQRH
jgi:hypothetical protein